MKNPISRLVGGSSFDPKHLKNLPLDPDIGTQMLHFEPYEPPAELTGLPRPSDQIIYPLTKAKDGKDAPPFDPMWRAIIDSLWKRAEPSAGAARGPVLMGAARGELPGGLADIRSQTYKPRLNPLYPGSAALPGDWKHMDQIKRTDAITMRGDSRPPVVVLGQDGGFFPPISRTDDYYVNYVISTYFKDYMKKRFDVVINEKDYQSAINAAAPSPMDKKLMADYMAWRKLCEGEAFHLGRMTADEAMKGYISTSKAFYFALYFALRRFSNASGWVYITRVRGGFIVPPNTEKWGTQEQEIAQWGPIKSEDILGFRRVNNIAGGEGPIWIRPTFRKTDPHAYKTLFKMLCNWIPTTAD